MSRGILDHALKTTVENHMLISPKFPEYQHLLDWYFTQYAVRDRTMDRQNSILALRGLGRELWADEDADSYVRRLREGWE